PKGGAGTRVASACHSANCDSSERKRSNAARTSGKPASRATASCTGGYKSEAATCGVDSMLCAYLITSAADGERVLGIRWKDGRRPSRVRLQQHRSRATWASAFWLAQQPICAWF